MSEPSPGTDLSREEVELVLRRAVELQHGEPGKAIGARTAVEEVEQIGRELGVSRDAIQAALVELRSHALAVPGESRSAVERWLGPRRVVLGRSVPGPLDDVRTLVEKYMRKQLFEVKRNLGERVVWQPAENLTTSLQRAFDFSKSVRLSADCIVETAVLRSPRRDGQVEVRFVLDFDARGRSDLLWSGVTAGTLTSVGAVVGVLAVPLALAVVPIVVGAGAGGAVYALARTKYRNDLTKQADTLARFLDHLEHER